jgi:exodeoxyribonuclease-3
MAKIITYNLNGIRSAINKKWDHWLKATNADVVLLQEIKATADQVEVKLFEDLGYQLYWFPAQKKGYSGVALFSRIKPDHVEYGMGVQKYDDEGRVIRADFGDVSVMSVYMPSGSSGDERQAFKMVWLDDFWKYVNALQKKRSKLVIGGDYNICHRAIDIHNPVSNKNSSGFLPEERAWMEKFFSNGFTDSFRHFNKDPHHYTWWTYRANARAKNLGWRIDYLAVTDNSDHCPVLLEIDL